ncbi:HAMP domain-containing sensor histidine kinase [Streptomyces sp. BE303]|uniref:HAMP domain-containing sensor histidine kinase n=1 Tax=Streptomyces sp. BE303 TaxID=3002528 RepID=UPI002E77FBA5|nr:ATP-binding protein [Streptomyces sp. BE303]MED7954772.1 histidine kinase dimerization/phospho-acceptor domain-containing protein [Streptomyces sp. BE303]
MRRFGHSLRWALIKAAVAGTTMVALAFLIPLGLMVQQTARDRAFTAAERQAAALGPALAITTDQDAIARAVASTDAGAQGRMAVHLPPPEGAGTKASTGSGPGATAGPTGGPSGGVPGPASAGAGSGGPGAVASGSAASGVAAAQAGPGPAPVGSGAAGPGPSAGATIGEVRALGADVTTAGVQGRSFTVEVPGGYALLQPVAVDTVRTAVVEVFVADGDLTRGVSTAWQVLSGVALALVAISVLVADRMGARIVASARRLAAAARSLGSGNLTVRVPVEGKQAAGSPEELREAAHAFNAMADRVVQLLAAERELAADLSHRLRTPLTVLRLNAASLGEGDAADATRHAVSQLEREVDQIIRSARRAPEDAPVVLVGCDAAEVIRERVGFWSALAEDEGRRWQLAGAERETPVPVQRGDLAAAVDALLGNVFRHTAIGTAFSVDVTATESSVIVLVGDAGPGFTDPAAALKRGEGHGGEGSTGLGLDIVRKLAEATGGDLALGSSSVLGGAEIRLRLQSRQDGIVPARTGRTSRRRSRGALFSR